MILPPPPYNSHMDGQTGSSLAPPGGLRPAQLGVILIGRVTLGHIAATVVDMAGRGYLSMELAEGDDPDWRLTDLNAEPAGLLDYERVLLRGLFDGPAAILLGEITSRLTRVLDKVRSEILRDASRAGRLGPGLARRLALALGQRGSGSQDPGRRTKAGEELLKDIKAFRRELRALATSADTAALARYAPYAMIFGLTAPIPAADDAPRHSSGGADPRGHTSDFAKCWQEAWASTTPSSDWPYVWNPSQDDSQSHATSHAHSYHGGHDGGYHGGGHDGGHGGFGGGHA
jgi:hypothetical protein